MEKSEPRKLIRRDFNISLRPGEQARLQMQYVRRERKVLQRISFSPQSFSFISISSYIQHVHNLSSPKGLRSINTMELFASSYNKQTPPEFHSVPITLKTPISAYRSRSYQDTFGDEKNAGGYRDIAGRKGKDGVVVVYIW